MWPRENVGNIVQVPKMTTRERNTAVKVKTTVISRHGRVPFLFVHPVQFMSWKVTNLRTYVIRLMYVQIRTTEHNKDVPYEKQLKNENCATCLPLGFFNPVDSPSKKACLDDVTVSSIHTLDVVCPAFTHVSSR